MMPRRICLVIIALSGLPSVSAQAVDIRITIDKLVCAPADLSRCRLFWTSRLPVRREEEETPPRMHSGGWYTTTQ
jgi:hypothetical protein